MLAYNSEHWLATHLNAYLRDNDEYRAITRETILRGLTGTITYTPQTITVHLQHPDDRRVTRALALLLEEINTPPHPTCPATTDPSPTPSHHDPLKQRRRADFRRSDPGAPKVERNGWLRHFSHRQRRNYESREAIIFL
jgi:hypothetical protein